MPFSLGFWANAAARVFGWSVQTLAGDQLSAAYAPLSNGSFFSTPNATGTSYSYSTNGLSWSAGTYPSSKTWRILVGNDTRVVALASTATTGGAAYSTNGTTWTAANLPSSVTLSDGLWDGTRFLVGTSSTGAGLFYSTDGATWSTVDAGPAVGSVGFNGTSTWIVTDGAASATTTARRNTSNPTVAGSWANITLPASRLWTSVVYGNGIWAAFAGFTGSYATSPDGSTWTSRSLPGAADFAGGARNAYFANGKFYLIMTAASGFQTLRSSSDGIIWETALSYVQTTGLDAANGWAVSPTKIVAVGNTDDDTYLYGA